MKILPNFAKQPTNHPEILQVERLSLSLGNILDILEKWQEVMLVTKKRLNQIDIHPK